MDVVVVTLESSLMTAVNKTVEALAEEPLLFLADTLLQEAADRVASKESVDCATQCQIPFTTCDSSVAAVVSRDATGLGIRQLPSAARCQEYMLKAKPGLQDSLNLAVGAALRQQPAMPARFVALHLLEQAGASSREAPVQSHGCVGCALPYLSAELSTTGAR